MGTKSSNPPLVVCCTIQNHHLEIFETLPLAEPWLLKEQLHEPLLRQPKVRAQGPSIHPQTVSTVLAPSQQLNPGNSSNHILALSAQSLYLPIPRFSLHPALQVYQTDGPSKLTGMGLDAVALRQETALLHIDFEHVQGLLQGIPLCWRLSKPQGSV